MRDVQPPTDRTTALLDLVIVGGVAIILVDVMSIGPATVVGGGVGVKLLFLGRVLLLLALATWRLRRRGQRWNDLGLQQLRPLRGVAAVVLGLIAIAVAASAIGALMAREGYPRANYAAFAPVRQSR